MILIFEKSFQKNWYIFIYMNKLIGIEKFILYIKILVKYVFFKLIIKKLCIYFFAYLSKVILLYCYNLIIFYMNKEEIIN